MAAEILLSGRAAVEIDEAMVWYENQKPELGFVFLIAIEESFRKIAAAPQRYPLSGESNLRHFFLQGFPYIIYYEAEEDIIRITAVWHQRRNQSI